LLLSNFGLVWEFVIRIRDEIAIEEAERLLISSQERFQGQEGSTPSSSAAREAR